jgi:hypothetical protein
VATDSYAGASLDGGALELKLDSAPLHAASMWLLETMFFSTSRGSQVRHGHRSSTFLNVPQRSSSFLIVPCGHPGTSFRGLLSLFWYRGRDLKDPALSSPAL